MHYFASIFVTRLIVLIKVVCTISTLSRVKRGFPYGLQIRNSRPFELVHCYFLL